MEQFTEISRVLFVIKRRERRGKVQQKKKKTQKLKRSLIGPIKVSSSNGSDVQGFVETLKDEGLAIAMA